MGNYTPQFKVKATYMRGGTSKGTFFNIADLPKEAQENQEIKNKFAEIAKMVNKKTFTIIKESKENGDLYGSVKPREITNIIYEQSKAEIGPSQITLKENLNKIGLYSAEINLHSEVKANISIKIDKIKS